MTGARPRGLSWEGVRAEILAGLARGVAVTSRAAGRRGPVNVLGGPVWAVYACSRCGARRAGLSNVLASYHGGACGGAVVVCLASGVTYAAARASTGGAAGPIPLGLNVPKDLPLSRADRLACARRLVAELDAGLGLDDVGARLAPVRG